MQKEELNNQISRLVYKDGERQGKKISDELQMSVEYLLDQQEIITEEARNGSPLLEKKEKILFNLSRWIERKKLEEICESKVRLVCLEKFGKLKEPLEDVEVFKCFLNSILEIDKANAELRKRLSELEKEIKEL